MVGRSQMEESLPPHTKEVMIAGEDWAQVECTSYIELGHECLVADEHHCIHGIVYG